MRTFEEELAERYRAFPDEELVARWQSGTLTDVAMKIAEAELGRRDLPHQVTHVAQQVIPQSDEGGSDPRPGEVRGFETVARSQDVRELHVKQGRLKAQGIPSQLVETSLTLAYFAGATYGASLLVPRECSAAAKAIIADIDSGALALEDHGQISNSTVTSPARDRASALPALKITLGFIALIWIIYGLNDWLNLDLEGCGIRPRELSGLPGILVAPLLHFSFVHIVNNSIGLLVVGTVMLHLYPNSALWVVPAAYLGPDIAIWFIGRDATVHLGSSGLSYGMMSYVFVAGLIRRDRRAMAASVLVAFTYGGLKGLRVQSGLSWEGHAAAVVIGLVLAITLRRLDRPAPRRYTWDEERHE